MTLAELAERLGAVLEGDGAIEVSRIAGIEHAGPGDVTFLANPKYAAAIATTRASAVILDPKAAAAPCAMLRIANPYLAFARAAQAFAPSRRLPPGRHPSAVIAADAVLGENVAVGPLAVIGQRVRIGAGTVIHPHVVIGDDAEIGPDCLIHARVSIREACRLGARVVVQDGAVIGADGFGFAHHADGSHEKIPQTGPVVIEDDVEIGANTTIDRPAVGETRIRAGAKIDNLVQIAHNVRVGRNCLMAAHTGISGSVTIGDGAQFGGRAGVADHVTIGAGARVGAAAGVMKDIPAGETWGGMPARPIRQWLKETAWLARMAGRRG